MQWYEVGLTIIASVFASSGFWAWMQVRRERKDAKTQMILGLGHDRIIYLCEKYIARGWITSDEYENLQTYLFDPYTKMGGNGTAKRLMVLVGNLPVKRIVYKANGERVEELAKPEK